MALPHAIDRFNRYGYRLNKDLSKDEVDLILEDRMWEDVSLYREIGETRSLNLIKEGGGEMIYRLVAIDGDGQTKVEWEEVGPIPIKTVMDLLVKWQDERESDELTEYLVGLIENELVDVNELGEDFDLNSLVAFIVGAGGDADIDADFLQNLVDNFPEDCSSTVDAFFMGVSLALDYSVGVISRSDVSFD